MHISKHPMGQRLKFRGGTKHPLRHRWWYDKGASAGPRRRRRLASGSDELSPYGHVRRIHCNDHKLGVSGGAEERFASATDRELRQEDVSHGYPHTELPHAIFTSSGCGVPAHSMAMIINAQLVRRALGASVLALRSRTSTHKINRIGTSLKRKGFELY